MSTINALILDLIDSGRRANSAEVDQIVAHVAQAPFASYLSRVPGRIRAGMTALGMPCPTHMPNVEWHLLERVYIDGQWPVGTSTVQYEADLHQAILHPDVEFWTYRYLGRPYTGFIAPSHMGRYMRSEKYIFVAYSPIFGTLTTGYQASSHAKIFDSACSDLTRHR